MDKDNIKSTLSELVNQINFENFSNMVNVLNIDAYVKKFDAYKFLQLFIVAQLEKLPSLGAISQYLTDGEELQKQIDLESISKSQLSRDQSSHPPIIFEAVFKELAQEALKQSVIKKSPIVRDIRELNVLDSSTMTMSIGQFPWAYYRQTKAGVKLHSAVRVTKDITIPAKTTLSQAKHGDRTKMDELIEYDENTINLFDRAYNDYKQFDQLCELDVPFITRLKKNAKTEVLSEQASDLENNIFLDQDVYLGNEQTGTKMTNVLRRIKTIDSEGNEIIIVTNCFHLTAKEICDLYRYRWKIETFFKWMKQHHEIKNFYGKSQNAVYNQIWIALITYLLLVLLQLKAGCPDNQLMGLRTLQNLLYQPFTKFVQSLHRKPQRKSKGRKRYDWEEEFQNVLRHYDEGDRELLDDLTYDPLYIPEPVDK